MGSEVVIGLIMKKYCHLGNDAVYFGSKVTFEALSPHKACGILDK